MKTTLTCAMLVAAAASSGCGDSWEVAPAGAPATPQFSAPPPPAPAPPAAASVEPAPTEPTGDVAADTERVKAEVGVGKRGRDYGGGIVTEVVKARFTSEQRIVYDIEIPKAMQLFRATNDRLPKTHEEFMREIIQANNISLPELPQGDRYVYDPKLGELMVERPAR